MDTTQQQQQQPLNFSVDQNGLIILTLSGKLAGPEVTGPLAGLVAEGSKKIAELYRARGKKSKILLDISDFNGDYDTMAIELMTRFAQENTPYVEKTASFGGGAKAKIAGEIIMALSYRDNIKLFDTKEQALDWLSE